MPKIEWKQRVATLVLVVFAPMLSPGAISAPHVPQLDVRFVGDISHDVKTRCTTDLARAVRDVQMMCTHLGLPEYPLSEPIRVVIYADYDAFDHVRNERPPRLAAAAGFFDPKEVRTYLCLKPLPTDQSDELQDAAFALTLRHELAHHVLHVAHPILARAMPPWLDEGLACAMEPRSGSANACLVTRNEWRLADARKLAGVTDAASSSLAQMLGEMRLGPRATPSDAYAASWLIVRTLLDNHKDLLGPYVQDLDKIDENAQRRADDSFNARLERLYPGITHRLIDPIQRVLSHGGEPARSDAPG